MRRYTLPEVARLFGIHVSTLRRWLHHSHIEPRMDPVEYRRRWLSRAQVQRLARDRRRVLICEQEDLADRVARLERRLNKNKPRSK